MAMNRLPLAPSLVFRPSCAGALAALLGCLALMACRGQGTSNTDGSSPLVASDIDSAADRLSKLTEGQNMKVPAAAIAKSCTSDFQCMLLLSDAPDENILSIVVGLNQETFTALSAELTAPLQEDPGTMALSTGRVQGRYRICRLPPDILSIDNFFRAGKAALCALVNGLEAGRVSRLNEINAQRSRNSEFYTDKPRNFKQRGIRRLTCSRGNSSACKSLEW
jgi:hypothetical protein